MTKTNFFRTLSEEDKNAARELAAEQSAKTGKKVTMLDIVGGIMTDAELAMPEPNLNAVPVMAAA